MATPSTSEDCDKDTKCVIRLLTQNRSEISLEDVDELIDDILTGHGDEKFAVDKESLKATAYHEAGHALVQYHIICKKLDVKVE